MTDVSVLQAQESVPTEKMSQQPRLMLIQVSWDFVRRSANGARLPYLAPRAQSVSPKYGTVDMSPKSGTVAMSPKYGTVEVSPKYGTGDVSPKYGTDDVSPKYGTDAMSQQGNCFQLK